ncbi:MAG: hypothetical protein FWE58_01215 [Methanobrevibacter sp.]|nr:hypothetical protein [Methanobrevibacter sp.]
MKDKQIEIQSLYPDKTKKIIAKFPEKKLREKKLGNELYRPYFSKNQKQIVKEINIMFKENNFDLKFYML